MTATRNSFSAAVATLATPVVRRHLAMAGAVLVVIGALSLALLPETVAMWVIVAAVAIGHGGLILVVGTAILARTGRRRAVDDVPAEGPGGS